jgi:hypothetical protein
MKHRNHVNVNNYRLATISPFLTYLYLVRTPLISLLLKAMYLYSDFGEGKKNNLIQNFCHVT